MFSPVVVFITKYTTLASTMLQLVTHFYPSISVEIASTPHDIKELRPFRVLVVLEEDICGEMLTGSQYPGKLRMVRHNHVVDDFIQILREEGIEPVTGEKHD